MPAVVLRCVCVGLRCARRSRPALSPRTVTGDLPSEVDYLERYEEFTASVQEEVADMPEGTLDLLTRLLHGNRGVLTRRARLREFRLLTSAEVQRVETLYKACFAGEGVPPSPDRPRPPHGAH